MSGIRWVGARRFGWVAAATLAVTAAGLISAAAEPSAPAKDEAKPDAEAKAKADPKAPAEALASLRGLDGAVKKEKAREKKGKGKEKADARGKGKELRPAAALPERPKKVVSKPTLTPEGLDALIDGKLAEAKVPEAATTTDVEFIRRVTLDLTGRLPSPEQVRNFVQTRASDKRPKLVEYLLHTPDFARNLAHYWRDVIKFRATNPNGGQVGYPEFEDWFAEQVEKNRPWDEIAAGLITASGRNDENGAVALSLAHESQAVELGGEVARIFMGVQIQCAQCHDHPTDSWKRRQFHEFASFFAGARSKRVEKGQNNVFEVAVNPNVPGYSMPDKEDPQKKIPVEPKFFLAADAPSVRGLTAEQRRVLVASYVTGQDNPWFARAFINRAWYTLMGEAFYSPVDDMGPDREAKSPELLEALSESFSAGGYDIRWLYRTILNTRAYQREIRSTMTQAGRTPFASNCPSRLRSDQILDSLDQVLDLHRPPTDGGGGNGKGKGAMKKEGLAKDLKETNGASRKGAGRGEREQFGVLYGVDPSTPNDDILGTIPQALFLMNGAQVNRALSAGGNNVLARILATSADDRQALLALYLRVFSRAPTPKELKTCLRYIELVGDRREAYEDIFWSLINSTEFITRR
jgi:Protein of unknown function (DUF1549)/Protein of unknown function (DUF1553)